MIYRKHQELRHVRGELYQFPRLDVLQDPIDGALVRWALDKQVNAAPFGRNRMAATM